jgi:hypothetical protein
MFTLRGEMHVSVVSTSNSPCPSTPGCEKGQRERGRLELHKFESTTIGFCKASCKRKPTPVGSLVVCGSIKYGGGTDRIDASTLVFDCHARVLHKNRNGAAAVPQRILHQHVQDLADQPWCANRRVDDACRDDHLPTFLGESILPICDVMIDQHGQVDFGPFSSGALAGDA